MFKVGDRVTQVKHKNGKFPKNGEVCKIVAEPDCKTFYGVAWDHLKPHGHYQFRYTENDLELIPEADEQVRQSLIDAGFEEHSENDSYYRHQKNGSITIDCDCEVGVWIFIETHVDHDPVCARSVVQLQCKSFSDARDLAICLLGSVK
jgi:hypothetical protein